MRKAPAAFMTFAVSFGALSLENIYGALICATTSKASVSTEQHDVLPGGCMHELLASFTQSNLCCLTYRQQAAVVKDPLLHTQPRVQLTTQPENERLGK